MVARCRRVKQRLRRVLILARAKTRLRAWPFFTAAVLVSVWLTIQYWSWLSDDLWIWLGASQSGEEWQETNSTMLRNVGLLIAGVIALPLAVWRSIVAQRQSGTAQQGLLNDRYQQGAEMLGNDVLSVRLGGIYALQRLAEEHPKQYHVQIMRLFCAFVRHPTRDSRLKSEPRGIELSPTMTQDVMARYQTSLEALGLADSDSQVREDVKAVMEAVRVRGRSSIVLEPSVGYRLDLRFADIPGIELWDADLSRVELQGVNLSGTWLTRANLSYANLGAANLTGAWLVKANLNSAGLVLANLSNTNLIGADLSKARLMGADLTNAYFGGPGPPSSHSRMSLISSNFEGAILSGADLRDVKNLTQEQLDGARADPKIPPSLVGAVDPRTGKPLEWRGKALDEET